MSAQDDANSSGGMGLSEAAVRFQISAQTLRRLCDSGQLTGMRDSRGWRVDPAEVEKYLLARRPPGRQSLALWLQGPAPNIRLRDGIGWLFHAAVHGGIQVPVQIWFSNELVAILQRDDHDVRDVVVRGAESLVADFLLENGELTPGQEILYGTADRSFVLRAAGLGDESYVSSEAPFEEGVSVLYDYTSRDGVWPGDSLTLADQGYVDVVVDTRSEGASRRVRTVRLGTEPSVGNRSRRELIQDALRKYESRCRRLGIPLGAWVIPVATRSNALTLSQQRVLELACDAWRKESAWPVFGYVEARMDHDYGIDLQEVLSTFPPGLLWGLAPSGRHVDKVALTVAGMAHCQAAAPDLELFMSTLRYLVQRRRDFIPSSSTETEPLSVTSDEVRRDVPIASESARGAVERLWDLLMQDSFLTHGGGQGAGDRWTVVVGPESRRYRGVERLEEYLARRQPAATPWDQPSVNALPRFVPVASLAEVLPGLLSTSSSTDDANTSPEGTANDADVFVLMPFAADFTGVWAAIQQTAADLQVTCVRADGITEPGRITEQIVEGIRSATAIVADVTGNNPNVMFELGYADALEKPIVVLNQPLSDAPFDLKDWRQITYSVGALQDMKSTLRKFLHQVLIKPREGMGKAVPPPRTPSPDRPIVDIRGSTVPGSAAQLGELDVKNVGGQPALGCRALIRGGTLAWFLGSPTTVGKDEPMKLAAVGMTQPFPEGLLPAEGSQAVFYSDPEGWLYRTSHGGHTESWWAGMDKPAWVTAYEALIASPPPA